MALVVLIQGGMAATAEEESRHRSGRWSERHPKLKKFLKAAGIGAVTGGIGGLVMGGSVAGRAVTGAGLRTGVTAARESRLFKKKGGKRPAESRQRSEGQ